MTVPTPTIDRLFTRADEDLARGFDVDVGDVMETYDISKPEAEKRLETNPVRCNADYARRWTDE